FLPPLDNLLWSRERIKDLFDFDYKWEIYTPRVKRQYGPYAMPILYGDRLIGRMDPQIDRKNKVLIVRLLQLEPEVKQTSELRQSFR
ncbi:crosslink repair DNA glycosylase YcaQ family protein, partial [Micrococcus sp. SIMBA_131]